MPERLKQLARIHGWSDACLREVVALLDERASMSSAGGWTEESGPPPAVDDGAPYHDLGELGKGGMGEIRRVWDRKLRREVAMKLLRSEYASDPSMLARFTEEAQATAQLEHPGIVPVHALGEDAEGRPYFTMKEVRGKTLTVIIAEVHQHAREGQWLPTPSGWSFSRLMQAFHRVCEAVGFAHARGVIHRDLKPDNIMLGAYGEVLVLDWGLAKVLGDPELASPLLDAVQTDRSIGGAPSTKMGVIAGTPAYMPPEQARGEAAHPAVDVYALGAILYEILSGEPAYQGANSDSVLSQVRKGPPRRLHRANRTWTPGPRVLAESPLPPELLVNVCERAMMRQAADRYRDAGELATAVLAFLEGAQAREHAITLVEEADTLEPRIHALTERAAELRERAHTLAAEVPGYTPIEGKRVFWELEDEARELEQQAAGEAVHRVQLLRGALSLDGDLADAHARLADHYRMRMSKAEAAGDTLSMRQFEWYLRAHDDGRHAAWLRGDGALTVITDPPGAAVEVYRYVERDRRLTLQPVRNPGRTPLKSWHLPMGSYLVVLKKEGYAPARYPVLIERQGHWDGVAPGESEPLPIRMLREGELGADDVYIPAGWFLSGGDAGGLPRRKLWLDPFLIRRFPATNRQWIEFLDALVHEGREEEALLYAPRERPGAAGESGNLLYGRRPDGTFFTRADAEGDEWDPDWPAWLIDWKCANAFAAWEAERRGQPWRLPWEFEWEKSARGVDGRTFPWGDHLDPTFTNMRDSRPDRPMPAVVDSFPVDESPYGVRGMAGNARDWCLDLFRADGPRVEGGRMASTAVEAGSRRSLRGGAFTSYQGSAGLSFRLGDSGESRIPLVGTRLCRSV